MTINEFLKASTIGAPKYVIIGAGWFGIRAVRAIESLSKKAEIVVLQVGSKDYIDINVANPRLAVEPDIADAVFQPLSKAWERANLVHVKMIKHVSSGKVIYIDPAGYETTVNAEGIIVATGAIQPSRLMKDVGGKSRKDRKAQLVSFRSAVRNSEKGVLIVGGGATGVELAGEIATDFPNVKCTLVNRNKLLLAGIAKRSSMHKVAITHLKKLGVNIILGDYVVDISADYTGKPRSFKTKTGKEIVADVAVVCTGGCPNVPFPAEHALDEKTKGLAVNGGMQCERLGLDPSKPVWAVGDCTMYGGRGSFADAQIEALSASIAHFEKYGSARDGPLKYRHKGADNYAGLISLGRNGGACTKPFVNATVGKTLKAGDMGITLIYKNDFQIEL